MPNQKFLDLLEKRKAAQQVKPEIVKPKEMLLTTNVNSPILLQASELRGQYPSYTILYCSEVGDKRKWLLRLNESPKEQS